MVIILILQVKKLILKDSALKCHSRVTWLQSPVTTLPFKYAYEEYLNDMRKTLKTVFTEWSVCVHILFTCKEKTIVTNVSFQWQNNRKLKFFFKLLFHLLHSVCIPFIIIFKNQNALKSSSASSTPRENC